MRRQARVDSNHQEIRDGLRSLGYYVVDLAFVGAGIPDLLVKSKSGLGVFLEVKQLGEYPTRQEVSFILRFQKQSSIIFSLDDALRVLQRFD